MLEVIKEMIVRNEGQMLERLKELVICFLLIVVLVGIMAAAPEMIADQVMEGRNYASK